MDADEIDLALSTLGARLAEQGREIGLLVIGGSSLLLLRVVDRPTADVDVAGLVSDAGYAPLTELPEFLATAVQEVGQVLRLNPRWLDTRPSGLLELGLPEGAGDRVELRRYGSLTIHLPGRADLVALKLLAAAVLHPANEKHLQDLVALDPTTSELEAAIRWMTAQDDSPGFADLVDLALDQLGGGRR
jgi:hypothetical protein